MVEDYLSDLAAGIAATVEVDGNVTTITLTGTDIEAGLTEAMKELFDDPEGTLSEEDKKHLTAITLVDCLPLGQATVVQKNKALELYPDDPNIDGDTKTKEYVTTGSPDELALLVLDGEQEIIVDVTPAVESLATKYIIHSNLTFAGVEPRTTEDEGTDGDGDGSTDP